MLSLTPLSLGEIAPGGWLRKQLRLQAGGLTGHLDEFWPDIARSQWIGGDAEGWERGPYWLDGLIPLAALLDDKRLMDKAERWVDAILAGQHEDGWLGAKEEPHVGGGGQEPVLDPWPRYVVAKALLQWFDATGDERVLDALLRCYRRIAQLLETHPLQSWAKLRWPELALTARQLHRVGGEAWLLELAATAQAQGYDWAGHFANFAYSEWQPKWLQENHVVNHAMALKADPARAWEWIATLDKYHGQITGVFTGDESLAGLSPSQGTELCAVVEYMYSLEVLLAASGDPAFADRLERIAYNALPATITPDMWAHQYVQQVNQAVCRVSEERVYTNNGPDSNLFGLEPNFGCCTANLHQGWPKLAASLWMRTPEGLAATVWAPCEVTTEIDGVAVEIMVATVYPFGETVYVYVNPERPATFALHLRIPAWAEGATVDGEPATPGTFHRVEREWTAGESMLRLEFPQRTVVEPRPNGAVGVTRGALVYGLKIGERFERVHGDFPACDWAVEPTTPWNYALVADPARFDFEFVRVGDLPFDDAPTTLTAPARRVPGWGLEKNAAAPPPTNPECEGDETTVTLVPYGCTRLRIAEFPVAPRE